MLERCEVVFTAKVMAQISNTTMCRRIRKGGLCGLNSANCVPVEGTGIAISSVGPVRKLPYLRFLTRYTCLVIQAALLSAILIFLTSAPFTFRVHGSVGSGNGRQSLTGGRYLQLWHVSSNHSGSIRDQRKQ